MIGKLLINIDRNWLPMQAIDCKEQGLTIAEAKHGIEVASPRFALVMIVDAETDAPLEVWTWSGRRKRWVLHNG